MTFPLLPKLRTTPRSLTQTTITSDVVSDTLTRSAFKGNCSLPNRKPRFRHQRNANDGSLKSRVVFLLLSAAVFLPACSLNAQTSQKEYLRQQAAGLKAQMVRAQAEQAADSGFAQKAYQAQQKYLLETAEKSFRIGKPQTAESHLVTGQAESYQAQPAMPPVHVAPTRYSVPPQRVAYAPAEPTYTQPRPAYSAPRQQTQAPQAYPQQTRYPRTITELPNPAEFGDQGESISSPANRVGLQDRLTSYLTKPKYHTSKLPVPDFEVTQQVQVQRQRPASQRPTPPPTPAARRTVVEQQPLFIPEPQDAEPFTVALTTLPEPEVSRIDEAAYERMAAAIAEREVAQAVAFDNEQSSSEIVPVSTFTPQRQLSVFSAPPRIKQSSIPTFYAPTDNVPTPQATRSIPAQQVSVLRRTAKQDTDDDDSLIERLRTQRNELPQPDSDSDSSFNSLRRPEPAAIDEEKEDLEQRLRELEAETERRDTKRRQRELERELRDPTTRSRRDDLRGEVRDDSDDVDNRPVRLTCDEHRSNLLGRSIRDISMDISPRASRIRDQYIAISRSWTDRLGNVVASGAMVDLRRGYVIIDGNNGRQKIPYSKLSDADWSAVSDYWQIPELCSIGDNRLPQRHWAPQSFTWTASSLCHKPLFFENQQLERYGHTHGPILQPLQSTAHFFVSLATLPYATAIHPPNECRYALGYYRPGNCAPWLKDPIPLSLDGLKRQALVTTGLSFLP